MSSEQVLTLVVTLAGRVVVDSTGVEDEGIWTSIHRDCHGPLGVQGLLQCILTAISLHKVALQQHNSLISALPEATLLHVLHQALHSKTLPFGFTP